jgi:hypothetical protein
MIMSAILRFWEWNVLLRVFRQGHIVGPRTHWVVQGYPQHLALAELLDEDRRVSRPSIHIDDSVTYTNLLFGMLRIPQSERTLEDSIDYQGLAFLEEDIEAKGVCHASVDVNTIGLH